MTIDPKVCLSRSLAALHYQVTSDDALSRQLAPSSLEIFYRLLLSGVYGRVFYRTSQDGTIVAICCVIFRFTDFNRKLSRGLLLHNISQILRGNLNFLKLFRQAMEIQKFPIPKSIRDFHFGMIARNADAGPYAVLQLRECCFEAFQYMASRGANAMWASTDMKNLPAIQFLSRIGFEEYRSTTSKILFIRTQQPSDSAAG